MHTYFVANHAQTRVKIGRSNNPPTRLASLQTGSHELLTILLVVNGDHEAEFHTRFAESRLHGEWFDYSYAIRKFVAEETGLPLRMLFHTWLLGQTQRQDPIGRFAYFVQADRCYPRQYNQLQFLFRYFSNKRNKELKQVLRDAHREWRLECTTDVDGTRYAKGVA